MIRINITLKFIGTGYKNCQQAHVKIYDCNKKLVYDGYSFNGIVKLYLDKDTAYQLCATICGARLITSFYVLCQKTFVFNLNPVTMNNSITFILTDYNYRNLPIMKGAILLD